VFAVIAFVAALQEPPARVVDGDTLDLNGARIRLYGVDAPEAGQTCERNGAAWPCGAAATQALSDFISGREVSCVEVDRDRYGRAVSTCSVGDTDLGSWMVLNGWALEFDRYSDGRYAQAEQAASNAGVGIHSGQFVAPADWRSGSAPAPVTASSSPPGDCRIKGNISSDGTRIYHMPGRRSYGPTRIDVSAGERWFCSEEEAVAAGWRAPRD